MRCNGGLEIKDTDLYFTFDLTTRSSSLNHQYYSEYQHILYDIISERLGEGMNYQEIADWLNNNGYTTVRGKEFGNAHAHSIIKKKCGLRKSDTRYDQTRYEELAIAMNKDSLIVISCMLILVILKIRLLIMLKNNIH